MNKLFGAYNEIVRLVFQNKLYEQQYKQILNTVLALCRRLNVKLVQGQLMPNNLKTKE
jgi:hypothetical protein